MGLSSPCRASRTAPIASIFIQLCNSIGKSLGDNQLRGSLTRNARQRRVAQRAYSTHAAAWPVGGSVTRAIQSSIARCVAPSLSRQVSQPLAAVCSISLKLSEKLALGRT